MRGDSSAHSSHTTQSLALGSLAYIWDVLRIHYISITGIRFLKETSKWKGDFCLVAGEDNVHRGGEGMVDGVAGTQMAKLEVAKPVPW